MTYQFNLSPLAWHSLQIGDILLDIPGGNIEQIHLIKITAIDYRFSNRQQEVNKIIDTSGNVYTYCDILDMHYSRR